MSSVFYGVEGRYKDVTSILISRCMPRFTIPSSDVDRATIFGDHIVGTLKHLLVESDSGDRKEVLAGTVVLVELSGENKIKLVSTEKQVDFGAKLDTIHKTLHFGGGNIKEELPEQLMVVEFLNPSAKVLELGANIGRNTLVIASTLSDSSQLVTLETDPRSAEVLQRNKLANGFKFHIEVAALSKRPLIQNNWNTTPFEGKMGQKLKEGWFHVKTIDYEYLLQKYNISFDTLVIDCEGAFFYILQDFPNVLNGVNTVIMENDYSQFEQKRFVDEMLKKNGLKRVCARGGGWGPCAEFFYEVWKK